MQHGARLHLIDATVAPEWVDYNGHMNDAAYAIVFSRAVDALMDRIGLDASARRRSGRTLFTLQTMLHYFAETREAAPLSIACHLLEHDDKRLRVWLEMFSGPGGARLAASEQLLISIDQTEAGPKTAPWRPETLAALDALGHAQKGMAPPPQAGKGVKLKRG